MAFDFTCLATFQPNSSATHSASVGARLVFTTASARSNCGVGGLREVSAANRFHHEGFCAGSDANEAKILPGGRMASASAE